MNVRIFRGGGSVVPFHNGRAILSVVPEVEGIASLCQVNDILAMQGVVGHRTVHRFLYTQTLAVGLEGCLSAGFARFLGLPAFFPDIASSICFLFCP